MTFFDVVDWELHSEPLLYSWLAWYDKSHKLNMKQWKKRKKEYLPHKSLCKIFDEVVDLSPVGRNTSRPVTKHMKNDVSTKNNQTPKKKQLEAIIHKSLSH